MVGARPRGGYDLPEGIVTLEGGVEKCGVDRIVLMTKRFLDGRPAIYKVREL